MSEINVADDLKDIVAEKHYERAIDPSASHEDRSKSEEALGNIADAKGVSLEDIVSGLMRFRFKKK